MPHTSEATPAVHPLTNLVWLTLALLVGATFVAIVSSFTMSVLWSWFVAPQYGDGPSYAVWYGLGMIFMVAMLPHSRKQHDDTIQGHQLVIHSIGKALGHTVLCTAVLGVAYFVGFVTHWR